MGWLALASGWWFLPASILLQRRPFSVRLPLAAKKSLLFRWHYVIRRASNASHSSRTSGSVRMGFSRRCSLSRTRSTPKHPASAHNVILDWFSTLGLFAFGWFFLLGTSGHRSVGRVGTPLATAQAVHGLGSCSWRGCVSAFWIGQVVGPAENDPLFWVLSGLGLFLGVFVLIGSNVVFERLNEADTRWCFAGAAAALLAMSMLDMIFFNGGSVGFCWAAFAAMSTTCSASTEGDRLCHGIDTISLRCSIHLPGRSALDANGSSDGEHCGETASLCGSQE